MMHETTSHAWCWQRSKDSASAGGAVHVASAGVDVTDDVALPGTDGAVTSLSLGTVTLAAGVQTLRVTFSGELDGVDFVELALGQPR